MSDYEGPQLEDVVLVRTSIPYLSFDYFDQVPLQSVYSQTVADSTEHLSQSLGEKLNLPPEDATSAKLFSVSDCYPSPLPASENKTLAEALPPGVKQMVIMPQLRPEYHKRLQSQIGPIPGAPAKKKKNKKKKKNQPHGQVDEPIGQVSDRLDDLSLDDQPTEEASDRLDDLSLDDHSTEGISDRLGLDELNAQFSKLMNTVLEERAERKRLEVTVDAERAERKKEAKKLEQALEEEKPGRKRDVKKLERALEEEKLAWNRHTKNIEDFFEKERNEWQKLEQAIENDRADRKAQFASLQGDLDDVKQDLQKQWEILKTICQRQT